MREHYLEITYRKVLRSAGSQVAGTLDEKEQGRRAQASGMARWTGQAICDISQIAIFYTDARNLTQSLTSVLGTASR